MTQWRSRWSMRGWLLRLGLRRRLREALLRGAARCLGRWGVRMGLPVVPALLARLPVAWRGPAYPRSLQNLALFGLEPDECRERACRHSAIRLQCALVEHLYPRHRPVRLRAWIRSIAWVDPHGLWARSAPLLVLAHTGEYWMAVACLVERHAEATRFVIPIWNFNDELTRSSLKSLEAFGHQVDILDSRAPGTALALARAIRRGDRVIIFADLPVSMGGLRSGEPTGGHLFGRAAQFVKGPMFLAAKLGCDVLLAGHRVQLGGPGQLHLIEWVASAPAAQMQVSWARAIERFLLESPQDWFYLSRMEAFFQRQQGPAQRLASLPAELLRRGSR
ncbi:hypothetical protein ACMGT0_30005 [Pseudomonas sp. RHF3.3-3]|uniref:hypothetical protein n=1 Tax=Pseudomonas sp. RHF3.3-3 TaxID=3396624 RepID=UPI003A8AF5D4